jgi:4-hydroxy-tetrahydrodipicolinate reductase
MLNIILSGCNGKMGRVITRQAINNENVRIAAGFDVISADDKVYPVFTSLDELYSSGIRADVIVDFSNPEALEDILAFSKSKNLPIVIATTGLSQNQLELVGSASKSIPVFMSANMSLGINLLIDLVKKAAKILESDFDIEIIEKHHNMKLDAPSGTAVTIADAINSVLEQKCNYIYDRHSDRKKRNKKEIGIHSIRGGTIVGEHSVIFAGNDEIIEVNHYAMSRDIFGIGAIRAAGFIFGKEAGIYSMKDLISE